MANFKRLHDLYRFPGFVPLPKVRGVFGDSRAVVITLRRRQKKRAVVSVAKNIAVTMTSDREGPGISRVATSGSMSSSHCIGCSVHGVGV